MALREIPSSAEQNVLWDEAAGRKSFTHPLRTEWLVSRHHAVQHVLDLLEGYTVLEAERLEVITMDGNPCDAFCLLARKDSVAMLR